MAGDKRRSWKEARQAERNRNMLMVAIPVILVILIVVIMLFDRSPDQDSNGDGESVTTQSAADESGSGGDDTTVPDEASSGVDESQSSDDPGTGEDAVNESGEQGVEDTSSGLFSRDAIPEINSLMTQFLDARAACDAEAINGLYGKSTTDTASLEQRRARLLVNARYISSYENLVCYTAAGLDAQTWMVFMLVDLRMRNSSTLVPTAMYSYVHLDAEGNYLIKDPADYTEEETAFISRMLYEQELIDLNTHVTTRLEAALIADPALEPIIAVMRADSSVWEEEETEPETLPEVQVLTE